MTVAEHITEWMKLHEMRHAFGIVGAGICPLFDAIHRLGYTEIVCTHHEQAAAMAACAYYRTCGKLAPVLVTTGGGSSNALTGVLAANMDSIPLLVFSGNERSEYFQGQKRARGVQGYCSAAGSAMFAKGFDEYGRDTRKIDSHLSLAYATCLSNRGGSFWLDLPMDLQQKDAACNPPSKLEFVDKQCPTHTIETCLHFLKDSSRPVVWLGNGVRLAGAAELVEDLLDHIRVPTVLSWSAADLLDDGHWLHYGRPGVYGQRCANKIVSESDLIIAIGTRLALPQTAYGNALKDKKLFVVDADKAECDKFHGTRQKHTCTSPTDAKAFIEAMRTVQFTSYLPWRRQCDEWKAKYPWVESPTHDPTPGYVNSYQFMAELEKHLKPDAVVVTDMGAALLSAHQALHLKKGQRLFTSQGLGEMGCGLPFAVGASFARDKGEVVCLTTDGGMMMNLQELQTIAHHNLPVKIVIFCNDGYGMIKNTQETQYGGRLVGVNAATGVSMPDFHDLFGAFKIPPLTLSSSLSAVAARKEIECFMSYGQCALVVHLDPDQKYLPKLVPYKDESGKLVSPEFEQLSPILEE